MPPDPADTIPYRTLSGPTAEPVVAATLCLMSAAMHSGCPRAMLKIERNLDLLSRHPGVSPNFQVVASRLAQQWRARALGLLGPGAAGRPGTAAS